MCIRDRGFLMRCCTRDEGWPFGAVLRGEASNRLMLRWLKTVVVSDEERRPGDVRWGLGRRPLLKHRKSLDDIKTGVWCALRDESGGCPLTGQVVSGVEVA